MRIVHLVTILLVSTSIHAGPVTVPNAFVSGTSAVAADVNENFQALADAINTNESAIADLSGPRVVASNGTVLGSIVGPDDFDQVAGVVVMTSPGYMYRGLRPNSGDMLTRAISYTGSSCTGIPLIDLGNGSMFKNFGALYYVDYAASSIDWNTHTVHSVRQADGTCIEGPGTAPVRADGTFQTMFPATPNNSAATGAVDPASLAPLTVE